MSGFWLPGRICRWGSELDSPKRYYPKSRWRAVLLPPETKGDLRWTAGYSEMSTDTLSRVSRCSCSTIGTPLKKVVKGAQNNTIELLSMQELYYIKYCRKMAILMITHSYCHINGPAAAEPIFIFYFTGHTVTLYQSHLHTGTCSFFWLLHIFTFIFFYCPVSSFQLLISEWFAQSQIRVVCTLLASLITVQMTKKSWNLEVK